MNRRTFLQSLAALLPAPFLARFAPVDDAPKRAVWQPVTDWAHEGVPATWDVDKLITSRRADDMIGCAQTASREFVEMDGSAVTLTTSGANVMLMFHGAIKSSESPNTAHLDFAIDGIRQGCLFAIASIWQGDVAPVNMAFLSVTPPSAGTHTYSIHWRTATGVVSSTGKMVATEL